VAGGAALLVDPTRVDAIADALRRVLDDPSERALRVERGFARAKELSWAETARKTLAVYQSLG